jgi:protocatechuate 3,4-dioxygenase beta subunit
MIGDVMLRRNDFIFTRRNLLLAGTAALGWSANTKSPTPMCALAAEQEEGPYYIDESTVRSDITEEKPGVPLRLRVSLVDAKRCEPLDHAAIDIWHCDALGVYSGFMANNPDGPQGGGPGPRSRGPGGPGGPGGQGQFGPPDFDPRNFPPPGAGPQRRPRQLDTSRFLRGVQLTDNYGRVVFATLYPGWYSGRAIHIHLKVRLGSRLVETKSTGGHLCHTGQLFFPEEITADVARLEPYANRLRVHRTLQSEDGVFQGQHGGGSMLDLVRLEKGSNAAGFVATVTLAVDPDATPPPVHAFGPGGPPPPR